MDRDPEHGPLLLLAEDNEVNQVVTVATLRRRGYQVDVVANGREAVAAAGRKPYAAVLMDVQMPVMDGYAAASELRSRENGARRVPIIALTAHAVAGERERCLAAGMDAFLTKPVRPDELAAALERLVDEPSVVDRGALERLRDAVDDDQLVARIVELFLAQADGHVAAIAQADDEATVRRSAHALKGSAATVGAVAVADIAAELERTGDAGQALRLEEALARTRAELV
jgi:two-component system, sensor histidine kinase and response regulator